MSDCTKTSIGQTPSTYERSTAWQNSGITESANIVAIDGQIGVVTIGMSIMNTIATSLASKFHVDSERHSSVTLVNGGISGKSSRHWSDPNDDCWTTLVDRIAAAGLTAAQCQLFWIMQTNSYPGPGYSNGPMTEQHVRDILDLLAGTFVNIQIGYLSGINYTGYSDDVNAGPSARDRAPEPYPYNDSLLMASFAEDETLPFWVDFYDVWADGITANSRTSKVGTLTAASDPIAYLCEDLNSDGVHPFTSGRNKQRDSVLERWRVDPVAAPLWLGGGDPPNPPPNAKRGLFISV